MPADDTPDAQDQAEVFDETHIDDEGDGDILPDEADPVLDVTRMDGDAADAPEPDDLADLQALDGVEAEADALLGLDPVRRTRIDAESDGLRGHDEIELVYSGLMRNVRGAQASAAHWEARRLADDDIADLGYGPEAAEDHP